MKAKELMYGDFVQPRGCTTPSRVVGISGTRIQTEWADGSKHWKDEYYFDPIALTPELLEKFGFRYEHDYGQYYRSIYGDYAKDREPVVCIGWNAQGEMAEWDVADGHRGASYGKMALNLHELQHRLRIVGLGELIDNYKF